MIQRLTIPEDTNDFMELFHWLNSNRICMQPGCTTCGCMQYRTLLKDIGEDKIAELINNVTFSEIKAEYTLDWHDALEILLVDHKPTLFENTILYKAYSFVWEKYRSLRAAHVDPRSARAEIMGIIRSSREWFVYIDMDGVLADFKKGANELAGIEPVNQNSFDEDDAYLWDGVRSVQHFYDKLELMQGADTLFRFINNKWNVHCELLTGIPKPHRNIENAGEDKIKWAHRILDKNLKVNIVFKEEKKNFCKGKNYILIDDLKANIDSWQDMGGIGIRFTDAASAIKNIAELGI